MTCPICYEDMDMKEFRDQKESTETCFKLECGHAFHTRCIVMVLSKTQHQCPSCNKHKTPEEQLEYDGLVKKMIMELKKDDRLKLSLNEYREAKTEYKARLKQLNDEARVWIRNRAQELKINEHRTYYLSSISAVFKVSKELAVERGNKFVGALAIFSRRRDGICKRYLSAYKAMFGYDPPGWRDWRLLHPRIYVPI